MIKLLPDLPSNVIGLEATGKVTGDDYRQTIVPLIEEKQREHDRVRPIYVLGPEFEGYDPGAIWDDTKLVLKRPGSWEKIAVVSDHEWLNRALGAFSWMVPGEFELFADSRLEEARDWISS